jgi:hypothetical protein
MTNKQKGPRAIQRDNILHAYRSRGHRNNNLWLIYSYKTNRDWVLPSDRHLVHWLQFLETDKNVKSFELVPEYNVASRSGLSDDCTALIQLLDGSTLRHKLVGASPAAEKLDPLVSIQNERDTEPACLEFSDGDLRPHAKTAVRWLKALAYAAAIREQECSLSRLFLLSHIQRTGTGTVKNILDASVGHDAAALQGVLVRLAIEGVISLDLSTAGFNLMTRWQASSSGELHA